MQSTFWKAPNNNYFKKYLQNGPLSCYALHPEALDIKVNSSTQYWAFSSPLHVISETSEWLSMFSMFSMFSYTCLINRWSNRERVASHWAISKSDIQPSTEGFLGFCTFWTKFCSVCAAMLVWSTGESTKDIDFGLQWVFVKAISLTCYLHAFDGSAT